MSKVSEKCKSKVLETFIKHKLSGKADSVKDLSDEHSLDYEAGYSAYTVDKAIYALLKEDKLYRDSAGIIYTRPSKLKRITSASQFGLKDLKPGCMVRIKKSSDNWSSDMDRFVGNVYIVSKVTDKSLGSVKFKKPMSAVNSWAWNFDQGHFDIISVPGQTPVVADTTIPSKDQILEAAKTSPEAEKALRKLFPNYFEPITKLLEFTGGIHTQDLGSALDLFQREHGTNMMVADGLAMKDAHKRRTITTNFDLVMVVFDRNGKEVFRSNDPVFFGFEKK